MIFFQRVTSINQFILHPNDKKLEIDFSKKIKIFLSVFLYKLTIIIFFIAVIYVIEEYVHEFEHTLQDARYTFSKAIILMVFFAPIVEELIFRFPLKYKRNYLFIGIEKIFRVNLYQYWEKYFGIILYLFVSSFGFLHLSNYKNEGIILYLFAPIIVAPQIWGGLVYSYIRLKLGFLWGILAHSLNNFLVILLLLSSHNSIRIDITDERMDLKVTELSFVDNEPTNNHYYYKNSTEGNIDSIYVEKTNLQTVLNNIYGYQKLKIKPNSIVNLTVRTRAKEGIDKAALLIELKKEFDIKAQ